MARSWQPVRRCRRPRGRGRGGKDEVMGTPVLGASRLRWPRIPV